MPKPYDATAKFLVEGFPADWLALAGLAPRGRVEVIDANLSTITAEADKVVRVDADGPAPWLAHVELQASREAHFARRLLRYNVLLDDRHGLPTRSIVVLLRPEADGPELSGVHRRALPDGPDYLEFRYGVVRVWQQPVESILAGGAGILPLAPVSDLAGMPPEEVIRRMKEKIDREPPPMSDLLWVSTGILMGFRYPPELAMQLLQGVRAMKESSFYQMILDEGRAEGIARGRAEGEIVEASRILIRLASKKFGPPDARAVEAIEAIPWAGTIEDLIDRLPEAADWGQLLAMIPGGA